MSTAVKAVWRKTETEILTTSGVWKVHVGKYLQDTIIKLDQDSSYFTAVDLKHYIQNHFQNNRLYSLYSIASLCLISLNCS